MRRLRNLLHAGYFSIFSLVNPIARAEDVFFFNIEDSTIRYSSLNAACEAKLERAKSLCIPCISVWYTNETNCERGELNGSLSLSNYNCGNLWSIQVYPSGNISPPTWGTCTAAIKVGVNCTLPKFLNTNTGSCESPTDNPKNHPGTACSSTPNPVNTINGNKHFDFTDIADEGASPLGFTRHYNSSPVYYYPNMFGTAGRTRNPIGQYWYHNYYQGLTVTQDAQSSPLVKLTRNTGQTFSYRPPASGNVWQPDADVNYRLEEVKDNVGVRTGWKVTTPNDTVETYSPIGDLLTLTDRTGISQTLTYSNCTVVSATCPVPIPDPDAPFDGLLTKVTDSFGKFMAFKYNTLGQLITVTAPSHTGASTNVFNYEYDSNGNLKTVIYPDDTPENLTDNPKTTYHYGGDAGEEVHINFDIATNATSSNPPETGVSYTHALTGITDENNVRFATYKYDGSGKAVRTVHNGAVDRYSLKYLGDDPNTPAVEPPATKITDPLNSNRTTHFTTVLGVLKPTGTDQPGGSGCSAAASNIEYNDTTGNVKSRTDFNGHKTCYRYEVDTVPTGRNLETARVEGVDTNTSNPPDCATVLSDASFPTGSSLRKISTEWHPTYRLPVKIAEPSKLTVNSYDVSGNLLNHSEQATTDPTGVKGLTATVSGAVRAWTYTYLNYGRIESVNGPRTDTTDITNYAYYADDDPDVGKRGNLKTITQPLGQITAYNSYTASGQPTQITAPNGVITELAYTPRGWLKTLTVKDRNGDNAEITEYRYTPTGLLEFVTLPDKTRLRYVYDNAHRLTDILQLDNTLRPAPEGLVGKVHYVLDAMGNRKEEEYNDPAGTLKRNISRVYDALNRLQTVTGAEQ